MRKTELKQIIREVYRENLNESEQIDSIRDIPDYKQRFPKASKFFDIAIMSQQFQNYYTGVWESMIVGESVELEEAEESLSWLERRL